MKLTLFRFGIKFVKSEPSEYFVHLVGVFMWIVCEYEDVVKVDDNANI